MIISEATIIIPTLNEEGNIKLLIDEILKKYPKIKIIIADDGSTDNTKKIVEQIKNKNIFFLDRSMKPIHGISESVMDASAYVKTSKFIVMDADFQHPMEKIKDISEKLENHDIIIAARNKLPKQWPLSRKLISQTAQLLAAIRLSAKFPNITDPGSGYFGIKTKLFKEIISKHKNKIDGRSYKILFDVLKYTPKNTKISYAYYDFALRKSGHSKINKKHIYYFLRSLTR